MVCCGKRGGKRAFTASSAIPSIYIQQFWDTIRFDKSAGCYRCPLDKQWFDLTKDTLREALQITPVNNNQVFISPPSSDALINFVNELGYPKLVRNLSNVVTNDMFQPWRALTTIINLCLTAKTSGFERPRAPVLQILWGDVTRAHIDYAERIWEEFTQSIHIFIDDKRNMAQHTSGKKKATLIVISKPVLGYLKFSAKRTKREVFRMPIPGSLITADIQDASYYQEYLAKVAKHQRYLAGETGSDPDSLASNPTKPAKEPKSTAPKAPPRPSVSKLVTSAQPEPKSAPAKTQGKKRKPTTDISNKPSKAKKSRHGFVSKKCTPISTLKFVNELVAEDVPAKEPYVDADMQRALEESLKSMYDVHRGPLPPVVIREPESEKYQPFVEVLRKGKVKISPIIDLISRPESPKVHQQLKATATDTTTTTTITLPPPPYQQQSTIKAIMMKCIDELEHIMANLIQENKGLEQKLDSHGAHAVDWAMQAPLQNRFRDLPKADMKVILHQRIWETESYKSHEDHMQLYEALEKSMNHDHSEELAKDFAEARKKKKKRPSGASGAPGASGSSQVPPPPPPPPSTNQESPSEGSTTPSSSKTAASAEYQAWTTTDIRLRPSISLTPADLQMGDDMALDEQAQSSDDEDIRRAHIPKVNLRQGWWKPLEEERPATPEPAWSIPSSDVPIPTNNWASALASNYSPPSEDSLLAHTGDIATFMDCVDESILRHNVIKPLPLGGPPGQVTIQSDFFFNKDLEYLRYDSKGSRPALSISKIKVAYYPDVGLEQMVPDQIWIEEECKYDIAAMYVDIEKVAVCSSLRSLKPKRTIESRAKRSSKIISLGYYSIMLASSHTVRSKTDIKSPTHYPCGFNSLVHSFRALSTLRRSGLRTASAAAKPCQGDSSEFYLITGIIYTEQRGTMVLATLFNKNSSSEASSDFHLDASSDSSSRHSLSDHSSPDIPSTSAGLSHKRCRSPMTYVPALPHVSGVLSPILADLIPSPKRVRDSGYLADVEVRIWKKSQRKGSLRGGFCVFCNSKAEISFNNDPNPNSFNDSQNLSDYSPQPQYETYPCQLCRNDSHYGYDYPPRFPFVYEQEPCYNQNYNDKKYQPEEIQELMCKLLEDVRNINEELSEYINSPSWNHLIFYDNDEEHSIQYKEYLENSSNAIAPVLPTEEPEYSLSMGECEVTSDNESECDVPVCEDYSTFDVLKDHYEILSDSNNDDISSDDDAFEDIDINRLIVDIVFLNDKPTPDRVLKSTSSFPIFENSDNSLSYSDNSLPEFKTFSDHTEETRSGSTIAHANNSLPEYDSFCFEIEPEQERLTSVVINDISDNSTNDPLLEEVNLFLALDNLIPPGIENFDYDSEGDIHFLEELLGNDSIPLPKNESSNFNHHDDPSFPRPPPEPSNVEVSFDFEPNSEELISAVMNNIDELIEDECFDPGGCEIDVFANIKDDVFFPFIFVIRFFLPYLTYPEITHPAMPEDIPELAQEGAVEAHRIVGVESAVTALTERVAELERDNMRLRGTASVESQRVDRLQRGMSRIQRELRQKRQLLFYDRVRVGRLEACARKHMGYRP
nr:monodehydroascorbate reductase [Tanacetum cinerariifolium]